MKSNIGRVNRALRIVVGAVLIALAATGTIGWWGWLGVVPLLSGLVGFCAMRAFAGRSACPMKKGM